MTNGMQSGDDSGLKDIWDEVCVQVQAQQSIFWNLYSDTIWEIVAREVEKLDILIKQAIWLQTSEAAELDDEDDIDSIPYSDTEITDHIMHQYVLNAAANWSNERIREYLNNS